MDDYVLNLGFIAFGHWWQFIAFAILFIMYIVMNVLPALVLLASFVIRKQNLIQLPFFLVFTLTPIVGTLVGRFFYEENGMVYKTMYVLSMVLFGVVISGLFL